MMYLLTALLTIFLQLKQSVAPKLDRTGRNEYVVTNRALKPVSITLYCGPDYEKPSFQVPAGSKLTVKLEAEKIYDLLCIIESYKFAE